MDDEDLEDKVETVTMHTARHAREAAKQLATMTERVMDIVEDYPDAERAKHWMLTTLISLPHATDEALIEGWKRERVCKVLRDVALTLDEKAAILGVDADDVKEKSGMLFEELGTGSDTMALWMIANGAMRGKGTDHGNE